MLGRLHLYSGDKPVWDDICPNMRPAVVIPATLEPGSSINFSARYPSGDDDGHDCRATAGTYRLVGDFSWCRGSDGSYGSCEASQSSEVEIPFEQR
jgi:hypothetical protein